MSRPRMLVVLLAMLAAVAWLGLRRYQEAWLERPIAALQQPVVFTVPAGASLTKVAATLGKAGLLDRQWIWRWQAIRTGDATRIQAGEYELHAGSSPAGLLRQFVAGDVLLYSLTIPEGWTFRQALAAIDGHPAVTVELARLAAAELARRLGLGERDPEGLFFPDTYRFPRGTTDRELLLQAHARLEQELAAAWQQRLPSLPFTTPYQALILASLVEKETALPDERPLIAGVFVNRLRKDMRLQTDPSVIYGLGGNFDGNLRRRDLLADTPYNSYTRGGLPPTPIALPGRAALLAATRPADTDALYFVATGEGNGRHYFAATLTAHNANVSRHLAALRSNNGDRVR